jgi:hypothetical protein
MANTKYLKTKQDQLFAALMAAFTIGFLCLLVLSSWVWLLSAPIYFPLAVAVSLVLVGGKLPTKRTDVETIHTDLLTVGGFRKPCTINVYPDKIIVTSKLMGTAQQRADAIIQEKKEGRFLMLGHGIDATIPLGSISAILFEDKSEDELSMAGFGIDYSDHGPARLMFFNQGMLSVGKTRKAVKMIQDAHQAWFKGCEVDPISVIDVSSLKKKAANSAVHRNI